MEPVTVVNGNSRCPSPLKRSEEVADLIDAVKALIVPFVQSADEAVPTKVTGQSHTTVPGQPDNGLVDTFPSPQALAKCLEFSLPEAEGRGKDGLLDVVARVLRYSVNTWDQGFLDKLYASTNAVGVVSEMVLAVLNTNLHVYQVSPALTLIEKQTARNLATLFGLLTPQQPHAGGIVCQGGSSSNLTSLIVARNTLYPETKTAGNGSYRFALFTSAHGHYSIEKAAVACGMGRDAVISVPVDGGGRMRVDELRRLIAKARDEEGRTPLYVNATAGTTVLGSFDPFLEIAEVAKQEGIWMHVDASWGGGVAFSNDEQRRNKLAGVEKANSVTFNPHKMLGVPVTCSFLLCHDMRVLHRANTMAAGYLFHGRPGGSGPDGDGQQRTEEDQQLLEEHIAAASEDDEVWDLADLTLQCGRRGDALKLALAWTYYGRTGLGARVDAGFSAAAHLAALLTSTPERRRRFVLVSEVPLPCLQVCFYYAPIAIEGGGAGSDASVKARAKAAAAFNTARTRRMVHSLVKRGFMVDYAPGDMGEFFRVVVNGDTRLETVEGLVKALEEIGDEDEARERAPNGELGMQRRTD